MKLIFLQLLLLITITAWGQEKPKTIDLSVVKTNKWILFRNDTLDYGIRTYKGKEALLLKRKLMNYKSASVAYPANLVFKNGTIEMDIALAGNAEGFVGLAFRIKDPHHYETVYFRPYSSGTINAIQYMPEKKYEFNWWDYEANKYQAVATLPRDDWFHVKVIVINNTMKVYLNQASKPSMVYNHLDPSLKNGSVGYWLGNSSIGAYKNLKVTSFP
ncbi:MAG: hypothetical protein EOP45_02520 [Sphingobacteriaceae bacterium]|nr:MAG: hypothetical protein EOP45_02520 [Sphingobacteriaceae bacterium]